MKSKKVWRSVVICVALWMGAAGVARAEGVVGSVARETKEVVAQFKTAAFAAKTQNALNGVVARAIKKLADDGHSELATRYNTEWNTQFSAFLLRNAEDLGDHRPLSAWLANFYNEIEAKLGKDVCHWLRLDDIKIINFGMVVVFQPRGDHQTGEHWDMGEYQKHFVPFTGAIVYWSSRVACSAATSGMGLITNLCGVAAIVPRWAVETWVAPGVSDWVYAIANKVQGIREPSLADLDETLKQKEEDLKPSEN